MKSLSLHEQFERYRREDQAKEADRQRRIEECAKEIRYWHRMQADMGHAGKNLREILFRYIT